ncbi:MAG: VCBS repeat-containing protein [Planctomycetes bacterium]|nr:VCBS repeat-containing protein [Planctomycetota bacterium]
MHRAKDVHLASCLAFALVATGVDAQQFTQQPAPVMLAGEAILAPIDLDRDGDDDLVLVGPAGGRALTLRSTGVGTFERIADLPVPGLVRPAWSHAPVGDVDGDGDLDLIGGLAAGGAIVLRNDGSVLVAGNAIPLPGGSQATLVWLRDLDRDGDLDLLAAVGGFWTAARNDGGGTFGPGPWTLPTGPAAGQIAFGDFDRDGAEDLLAVDNPSRLWMRRGNAFVDESAARLPPQPPAGGQHGVVTFDLDRDGDLDLAGPRAWLFRNDGTGRFSDASGSLPTYSSSTRSLAHAGDLDGDGQIDLLLGGQVLIGNGPAAFTWRETLAETLLGICDWNGDGFPDLHWTNGFTTNIGGRRFATPIPRVATFAADLDRDGDTDLLGSDRERARNEASTLVPDEPLPATLFQGERRTADVDGDGDLDLLAAGSRAIVVGINDGRGGFSTQQVPCAQPWFVTAFDRDGDGDQDILATTDVGITLFDNRGNLVFVEVASALARHDPGILLADLGDFDADGDADLLFGRSLVNLAAAPFVLRNRGDGTFADDAGAVNGPADADRGQFAQLDGDPALEIVFGLPTLAILDRVGDAWQDVTLSQIEERIPTTRVVVIDFDEDGRTDLVAAGGRALRNGGNGRFHEVSVQRGPWPTNPLGAVDFDGDGDLDLLDGNQVWLNGHRQLQLTAPARLGRSLGFRFVAERGYGTGVAVALPLFSLGRAPGGIAMFGGVLFLDPAAIVPGRVLVAVTGQPVDDSLPIPAQPGLRGLVLQIQGVAVGSDGRAAPLNHLSTTVF